MVVTVAAIKLTLLTKPGLFCDKKYDSVETFIATKMTENDNMIVGKMDLIMKLFLQISSLEKHIGLLLVNQPI